MRGEIKPVWKSLGLVTACLTVLALGPGCAIQGERRSGEIESMEPSSGSLTPDYLPKAEASQMLTVTTDGLAMASITVLAEGVATKETGPKETVKRFGEVYSFAPSFIAVRRDEPTRIRFWNLQPDDVHDFMLLDPRNNVLMKVTLPPLKETNFVFTFHEEGLFPFYCTMHRPAMNGQILVLPPRSP